MSRSVRRVPLHHNVSDWGEAIGGWQNVHNIRSSIKQMIHIKGKLEFVPRSTGQARRPNVVAVGEPLKYLEVGSASRVRNELN